MMNNKDKIAILLLVHKNESQINRLINHLKNDFDVFVHIDKRFSAKIIKAENVFVYKKYKPHWGSIHIVLATLLLLQEAHKKGYKRYILLSGQDIPIKSNSYIKDYFQNNNNEYIDNHKFPIPFWKNGGWDRVSKHWCHATKPNKSQIISYSIFLYKRVSTKMLNKIKKLSCYDYEYYGGSQWFSFTDDCVTKIFEYLRQDKKYIKRFFGVHCSDEIFFQTLINILPDLNIINDNLRYIDWENGPEYPRIIRINDFERITKADSKLFARKIDEKIDNSIIDLLYTNIKI